MEVSKRKNGSRYREKIYFNGKEVKSPYFIKKTDAKAWKIKMLAERDQARLYGYSDFMQSKNLSFREFAEDWLNTSVKIKNSYKTYKAYESVLKNHLYPYLELKKLQSIDLKDGQELVERLQNQGYKPKGISNIVMVLKCIFNEAERLDYILKNPLKFLHTPKIPKKVPKYWTDVEINQFLRANRSNELYSLYVTALNTGCRRGELAGLMWHQVLFDRNLIEISATRDKYGRRERTKNGKNRYIPMNEVTRSVLLGLNSRKTSDLVFVHDDGTPLRVHHLYRYFKRDQEKAEISNLITFHKLRDTFASQFMMNGGNIYELQKILGHSSIDMTQIYAHLSPDHLSTTTKIVSFGEIIHKSNAFRPDIGPSKNEVDLLDLRKVLSL